MTIKEYDIENLNCAHCSAKIEDEIGNLAEVSSVNLDYMNKKLIIQYSGQIENALERLNIIASKIEPGVQIYDTDSVVRAKRTSYSRYLIALGILVAIPAILVPGSISIYLMIAAWFLVGHRVIINAGRKLMQAQVLDENFLMSIAGAGALFLGEHIEALAVMLLYEFGQYWEDRAVERSRSLIKRMLSVKPELTHHVIDGKTTDKKLSQIEIGNILLVYPGEKVPLDGVITKGDSSVDTSSLTGEAEPVPVSIGSTVLGGFINRGGLIEIEVSHTESESTVSRIMKLIENAAARKSNTEKFITRFAKWYTPIVVGAAVLLLVIPMLMGASLSVWLPRALIFLIVSCPCALVISVPLTYYIGIGLAARRGVIFKGSAYLDSLRLAKTFVFDKTGTLTTGMMKPAGMHPVEGIDPEELKLAVYRAEHSSNHPLAIAVREAFSYPFDSRQIEELTEIPGKGISMVYAGDSLLAGSYQFMKDLGYVFTDQSQGQTAIHAVVNEQYLGYISFEDEVKPGMKEALTELRSEGVQRSVMLSGDRESKARQIAELLGLDAFHADLLPHQKLGKLEELMVRNSGKTVYVGDGLNDAPVLARADIGIAMGEIGNAASIESADIVLLNDKPEQLIKAVKISKLSYNVVVQNIALALSIKVLVMILGAVGLGKLWEAVIADVGVTLLAIFNALRLSRIKA